MFIYFSQLPYFRGAIKVLKTRRPSVEVASTTLTTFFVLLPNSGRWPWPSILN